MQKNVSAFVYLDQSHNKKNQLLIYLDKTLLLWYSRLTSFRFNYTTKINSNSLKIKKIVIIFQLFQLKLYQPGNSKILYILIKYFFLLFFIIIHLNV